ncbi:MAG: hypothetical protein ACRDFZ_02480 [Candidatus Limnocylindria bacterium]
MKIKRLGLLGVPVLVLAAVLPLSAAAGGAQHVSWDIISVSPVPLVPPLTFNPGGIASAQTPEGETITLTGSGTFVAPGGNNGGSGAVTGGGTWTTSSGGSGTYVVKELVSWHFANLQGLPGGLPVTDNTGDSTKRANGTAVLRIEFSDGQSGVLTVGCHGPAAPAGIFEGIATTKGFTTYYNVPAPLGTVDAGRTIFHVD